MRLYEFKIFSRWYRKSGSAPANPNNSVSTTYTQLFFIPNLFDSNTIQINAANTTQSKSVTNAAAMRLPNIPFIVAFGSSHNKMFPVSTDSWRTKMLGAINPTMVRTAYMFFIVLSDYLFYCQLTQVNTTSTSKEMTSYAPLCIFSSPLHDCMEQQRDHR